MNYKDIEQEQLVGYWAKTIGLSKKTIDTHPQIDDIILLRQFRQEFWDLPNFWRTQYDKIYSYVYKGRFPLTKAHLRQLTRIARGMIKWRKKRTPLKTQVVI